MSAFFMVNVELPPWSHYVSGLNVILFAITVVLGDAALARLAGCVSFMVPFGHLRFADREPGDLYRLPIRTFRLFGTFGCKIIWCDTVDRLSRVDTSDNRGKRHFADVDSKRGRTDPGDGCNCDGL